MDHIIELQMVRPHHKTPKIKKNPLLCRKVMLEKRDRKLESSQCEGKEDTFLFEKQMKVKPWGNSD